MPINPKRRVVVFVHGWSVTHTDTYGGLPERLAAEAEANGEDAQLRATVDDLLERL